MQRSSRGANGRTTVIWCLLPLFYVLYLYLWYCILACESCAFPSAPNWHFLFNIRHIAGLESA